MSSSVQLLPARVGGVDVVLVVSVRSESTFGDGGGLGRLRVWNAGFVEGPVEDAIPVGSRSDGRLSCGTGKMVGEIVDRPSSSMGLVASPGSPDRAFSCSFIALTLRWCLAANSSTESRRRRLQQVTLGVAPVVARSSGRIGLFDGRVARGGRPWAPTGMWWSGDRASAGWRLRSV